MGRHLTKDSMPRAAPLGLRTRLSAAGITRLVVGHTPHGNCPTIIKTGSGEEPRLEVRTRL